MQKRAEQTNLLRLSLAAAILVFLPPCVSRGFRISEVLGINVFILTHAIKPAFAGLFPAFNLIVLITLLGAFFLGKPLARTFSFVLSLTYLLSGLLQNISISDRYGLAICLSTLCLTLFTAGAWGLEYFSRQNDFTYRPHPLRLAVLAPVALLAIWQPLHPVSLGLDFNLAYFLSSGSSLAYCMLTTASLAVMLAYFPYVNRATLAVTSLTGLLIGLGNLWLEFIYLPELFEVGILHIPLVILSAVGISLSVWEAAARAEMSVE